ncbi:MAG: type IV pilus assembly protein PilM [Xenococcaceae cyanobacterium]
MLSSLKNLFSKKRKVVGIEITPEKINLAQLSKEGQKYKLVKYCSMEIPEGIFEEGRITDSLAIVQHIQEMLAEHNIKVKHVATAVPMREAIIRIIPIPAELDDQELREVVLNQEAELCLPYPREEVDLDYQKLSYFEDEEDGIEKVKVLLVATRREVTDLYMETLQEAGLQVDVLEINSFALIRTIREQLRQFGSTEAAVLVDIEFDNTEIAIIVDGVPEFSRTVPIGTYQLQTALSQAMNLPLTRNTELLQGITIPNTPVEGGGTGVTSINPGMAALLRVLGELTDELRRSINFYLNQSGNLEVAQLLLAGPGAGIGQLDEYFTQRLSLPTMQVDPVAALGLEVDEEIPTVQRPGLGIVLGLGMRVI